MSGGAPVVTQSDIRYREQCLRTQNSASEDWSEPTALAGPQIMDHSLTQTPASGPGTREQNHPKMMSEHSQSRTMEQSPSLPSSSSSSSSHSPTAGAIEKSPDPQMKSATCPSIRKRPRISDLLQHASTSRIPNEKHPAQLQSPPLTPSPKRRCASADAAVRARSRFASPDRYIPQRPNLAQDSPAYRTSKPPSELRASERYTRSRDTTQNPFRSTSDRSAEMARRRNGDNVYGLRPPHYTPSFINGVDAAPFAFDAGIGTQAARQLSWGGFWTVGGRGATHLGQLHAVQAGSSSMLASGTNAPMHTPTFLDTPTKDDMIRAHEGRLALAMDVDQASRVLQYAPPSTQEAQSPVFSPAGTRWRDNTWTRHRIPKNPSQATPKKDQDEKRISTVAFRVLDAPHLKDDYYCSILAYCHTSRTLAVALTHKVYLWTEEYGVRYPPLPQARTSNFVTSLAFSSEEGGKSILAVARHSGGVTLWSLLEARPRFEAPHPAPASCVAFRPTVASRQATNSDTIITCEDLLVGDDAGRVYYYSLEWPNLDPGYMSLLIKLDAHSQNICGLAWAPDGEAFVSGGNDNVALLFQVDVILDEQVREDGDAADRGGSQANRSSDDMGPSNLQASGLPTPPRSAERAYIAGIHPMIDALGLPSGGSNRTGIDSPPETPIAPGRTIRIVDRDASRTRSRPRTNQNDRHRSGSMLSNELANPGIVGRLNMHTFSFTHSAAVKAMAFAPWQPSLLATGGGSNDRQIHFHHTGSGATLAVINVFAQVTSLVWSTTRRELVATFGYAQPEHEIRVAVFSWPSCECVVSIPWERKLNGEIGRALWAISYPGGPNDAVPTRRQNNEGFAA